MSYKITKLKWYGCKYCDECKLLRFDIIFAIHNPTNQDMVFCKECYKELTGLVIEITEGEHG